MQGLVRNLRQLLANYYAINTRGELRENIAVNATSPTEIVPRNPNRVSLTIVNVGTQNVFLSMKQAMSNTKGIYLQAGGGSVTFNWDTDFQLVAENWFGMSVATTSEMWVLENLINDMSRSEEWTSNNPPQT